MEYIRVLADLMVNNSNFLFDALYKSTLDEKSLIGLLLNFDLYQHIEVMYKQPYVDIDLI